MITAQFLENDDTILPDDWCRPLQMITMSGGMSDSMSYKGMYSGTPENNVKWVRVQDVLGPRWKGARVIDINKEFTRYEFVRGNIQPSSKLDMKGFTSYAGLWKD